MCSTGRRRLPFDDSPLDPQPEEMTRTIATLKHEVGQPGRFDVRLGAMAFDEQVRRAPDIEVGNHQAAWLRD